MIVHLDYVKVCFSLVDVTAVPAIIGMPTHLTMLNSIRSLPISVPVKSMVALDSPESSTNNQGIRASSTATIKSPFTTLSLYISDEEVDCRSKSNHAQNTEAYTSKKEPGDISFQSYSRIIILTKYK